MKERFVPIRPGIEEHLLRGDMSLFEFGIYVTAHLQADYRTGIWHGSAPRIMATAPRGVNLRDVQRALEHLEELGYLKSFRKQGERGNTPYLIHKFTVRSGGLKGMRLNASESVCWKTPAFEPCAEVDTDTDAESVAEDAPSQEVRSKKKEEKKENHAASPPADRRYQPFLDFAFQAFKGKNNHKPAWDVRDFANLKGFLRKHSERDFPLPEMTRRFASYMASTEHFIAMQGDSLWYFLSKFDTFKDGPIHDRPTGGSNGRRLKGQALDDRNFAVVTGHYRAGEKAPGQ